MLSLLYFVEVFILIDITELKPILEPILDGRDDAADIIEQISAIDNKTSSEEDIARINAEWSQRFKKAFFTGEGVEKKSEEDEPDDEDSSPETYEELFEVKK